MAKIWERFLCDLLKSRAKCPKLSVFFDGKNQNFCKKKPFSRLTNDPKPFIISVTIKIIR